ncbi:hypothetical protein IAU60_006889 [Kwoniella sp. DSM 27419]
MVWPTFTSIGTNLGTLLSTYWFHSKRPSLPADGNNAGLGIDQAEGKADPSLIQALAAYLADRERLQRDIEAIEPLLQQPIERPVVQALDSVLSAGLSLQPDMPSGTGLQSLDCKTDELFTDRNVADAFIRQRRILHGFERDKLAPCAAFIISARASESPFHRVVTTDYFDRFESRQVCDQKTLMYREADQKSFFTKNIVRHGLNTSQTDEQKSKEGYRVREQVTAVGRYDLAPTMLEFSPALLDFLDTMPDLRYGDNEYKRVVMSFEHQFGTHVYLSGRIGAVLVSGVAEDVDNRKTKNSSNGSASTNEAVAGAQLSETDGRSKCSFRFGVGGGSADHEDFIQSTTKLGQLEPLDVALLDYLVEVQRLAHHHYLSTLREVRNEWTLVDSKNVVSSPLLYAYMLFGHQHGAAATAATAWAGLELFRSFLPPM